MKKIIDKKIIKTEKEVGVYKANFNTSFNAKDSDSINLTIQFSEDLRLLCKEATIQQEQEHGYDVGGSIKYKQRYKVKKWVMNTLGASNREMLFLKELVDTGKIVIPYYSTAQLERVIMNYKENMRVLIQTMLKFSKIETTMEFNLK